MNDNTHSLTQTLTRVNSTLTSIPTEPGIVIVTITANGTIGEMPLIRERAEQMAAQWAGDHHTHDLVDLTYDLAGCRAVYRMRKITNYDAGL